jgi:peptide-methionine (S)-S-oxide reductase
MSTHEIAVFGGGCFWCTEAVFKMLKGVSAIAPGYSGGNVTKPTYEQVCNGDTGHAEVIQITYDSSVITYKDLLTVFFGSHDPTTVNRQGNDVGTQYRSVIFYTTPTQMMEAEAFIEDINDSNAMGAPLVTDVVPLDIFYEAENYHHDYFARNPGNPYCQVIINPKLEKVQEKYAELLKDTAKQK